MGNTRNTQSGRTSQVRSAVETHEGVTFAVSSKRSQKPKFQCLFQKNGQTQGWYEATELVSLGDYSTPNSGESPNAAVESFLSQVLEKDAPQKYSLSKRACEGILRRAAKRGKELPLMLKEALEAQCGEGLVA